MSVNDAAKSKNCVAMLDAVQVALQERQFSQLGAVMNKLELEV